MIVITKLVERSYCVCPGDEFHLTITDGFGSQVIIDEKITENKIIDFIASIRFALENGTSPGFHLMGVFACKSELPKELREAILFENLTLEQQKNFAKSVGVVMNKALDGLMGKAEEEVEQSNKPEKKGFFGIFKRRL